MIIRYFLINTLNLLWLPRFLRFRIVVNRTSDYAYSGIYHDHYGLSLSVILKNGFWEHDMDGTKKWLGPGSFYFRPRNYFHTISNIDDPAWSLFFIFMPGPDRPEQNYKLYSTKTNRYYTMKEYIESYGGIMNPNFDGVWEIFEDHWLWFMRKWRSNADLSK